MPDTTANGFDADVIIIGSGFGGSVAALRFVEAGEKVLLLERGDWVTRANIEADLDLFWDPERDALGPHQFRFPGKDIFAWVGSAVGGGSNLFAAVLKRRDDFEGFPAGFNTEEMGRYYAVAEEMMAATPYPDYAPYSKVRGTQLLYHAGARLAARHPELVEAHGPLTLGISFAPPGGQPGAPFVNKHGAPQRFSDPREQSILGGDVDSKNSLDRNYLFLAQQKGATIKALHQATRIEPIPDGYRVHYRVYAKDPGRAQQLRRRWFPKSLPPAKYQEGTFTARRLVIAAGVLGSTELLLRSRDEHKTLPHVSPVLGHRYSTNGDYITFLIPFRGIFISWFGFLAMVVALLLGRPLFALPAALLYYVGLWVSQKSYDPDIGTTCSDHIRFRGPHGEPQGVYIEGGRYPTPDKWSIAAIMSMLGVYHPDRYRAITRWMSWLRRLIPPFGALARTFPLPLLTMGRDSAYGTIELDDKGEVTLRFDLAANREYYRHADRLGKLVARVSGAWWLPNELFKWSGRLQVPHNLGGCPMGNDPGEGVVDHAGRVFGYKNLMVLDGSIIPAAVRPNPALTILAVSERAMAQVLAQLKTTGEIVAEPMAPRQEGVVQKVVTGKLSA